MKRRSFTDMAHDVLLDSTIPCILMMACYSQRADTQARSAFSELNMWVVVILVLGPTIRLGHLQCTSNSTVEKYFMNSLVP